MRCLKLDDPLIGINTATMFLAIAMALVVVRGEEFSIASKTLD